MPRTRRLMVSPMASSHQEACDLCDPSLPLGVHRRDAGPCARCAEPMQGPGQGSHEHAQLHERPQLRVLPCQPGYSPCVSYRGSNMFPRICAR